MPATRLAAQEVPPPTPNLQTIATGSLVIPMDNTKQNLGGLPFNTKAYGLAFDLLHHNIPVLWAIRSGKLKDAADFTATARRVAPSTLPAATLDFAGGPFIVPAAYATQAMARVTAFGGSVAVYALTAPVTVDVRYTLQFKPRPFVNNVNAKVAVTTLEAAGIPLETPSTPGYVLGDNANINANGCWTVLIEPHNSSPALSAIRTFVLNGGNYYAQCASVTSSENDALYGHIVTTNGLTISNVNNDQSFPNPDLSFSQFVGGVENAPGGSETDWILSTGSTFQPSSSIHAQSIGATPTRYSALARKLVMGLGGNVFYLGGHDNNGTTLGLINLQRMLLNAVMTPAARPSSCGFVILQPDLTIAKTHAGSFVAGTSGTYTLTATNIGTAATLDTVVVVDTLPTGLTYVSASGTGWTFTVAGPVVSARYPGAIAAGGSASFTLVVSVGATVPPGTLTNRAGVSGGGEINTTNNSATDATQITVPGVNVTPDNAGPVSHLPSNGIVYAYPFSVQNTGTAASPFTLIASLGSAATPFLTIDSITGSGVTRGTRADSAQLATLQPGASATVTVWFHVGNVDAGLLQQLILTAQSTLNGTISDPGSVTIKVARPGLTIQKQVAPTGTQTPGTDLSYTVTVTNIGSEVAVAVVVIDSIPPQVMFKIGSIANSIPSGSVAVEYSNNNGATWTYTPVSAGCSSPSGYDGCVTRIRWTLANPLGFTAGANVASHMLVARLR